MQTDTVIDLTTPRTRTVVKMDSGTYRFRSPYDLTIEETSYIDRTLLRFAELTEKGKKRTAQEAKEIVTISEKVCRLGLLEGDAKAAGPIGQLVLADFFFDLCLQTNLRLGQVRESMSGATKQLIGDVLFPSSSGPTAAPPARGSRKRR